MQINSMGKLITIEGGEFTGKTSVVAPEITSYFRESGMNVLLSREPGGTPHGEKIREHIFKRLKEGAHGSELALLFNKARKIHLDEVIIPFLGKHKEKEGIVILDRYLDSTIVYEGMEGGADADYLLELEKKYVGDYYPDLTIILYFPEDIFKETLLKRKKKGHVEDARSKTVWDRASVEIQLTRQRYYLQLPEFYKEHGMIRNFILVDASKNKEEVVKECIKGIKGKTDLLSP